MGDANRNPKNNALLKRLSIGLSQISNPSVIFLDYPVEGLDSFQSISVITCIRKLVDKGLTVVGTFNLPRSSVFSFMDDIVLLGEGETIYHGPAEKAIGYFDDFGYTTPAGYNPCDFFIDCVTIDERSESLKRQTLGKYVCMCMCLGITWSPHYSRPADVAE